MRYTKIKKKTVTTTTMSNHWRKYAFVICIWNIFLYYAQLWLCFLHIYNKAPKCRPDWHCQRVNFIVIVIYYCIIKFLIHARTQFDSFFLPHTLHYICGSSALFLVCEEMSTTFPHSFTRPFILPVLSEASTKIIHTNE